MKLSLIGPSLALSMIVAGVVHAQTAPIEEMVIIGVRDTHTVRTDDTMVAPPDTAQLLKRMPGANVNKNGELTGIAQYRGMHGDRVNVSINGARISSGGPNAMDSPLHYAPVAMLDSLTIRRGITPVSVGQETIGGHVEATTYSGDFGGTETFGFNGRVYAGGQSFNDGYVGSAHLSLANYSQMFSAFVMIEEAEDSRYSRGKITPSSYERERYDLGYGFRSGDHEFSINVARNETGNAGTAALPMDIESFDSDLVNSKYQWFGDSLTVTAEAYYNEVGHWMSNFHLRRPPSDASGNPNPAQYRRTFTSTENFGFKLKAEQPAFNGLWRYGADGHFAEHDALIGNPNAPGFFVQNFTGVERDVLGVFVERELKLTDDIGLELGARYNRVSMNSSTVASNLNPMNMPAGMPFMMNNLSAQLAADFNAHQLKQHDNNLDWVARFSVSTDSDLTWYAGLARKTRSPSYQERFLWSPMESTGGMADGKTYIGNIALEPEVAHEVEAGFDYMGGDLAILPRVYYKHISNYIQGTPSGNVTANTMAQMMANMGMGAADPLQFNNVGARIYGFDLEGRYEVSDRLDVRAVMSAVRGERRDISDDLYRISPDNFVLALDYRFDRWMATVETVAYSSQSRVSETNLEQPTSGYALINMSGRINLNPDIELVLGLNNALDKFHRDHLGAYNRAFNENIGMRERLPGAGRNLYGRVMWRF